MRASFDAEVASTGTWIWFNIILCCQSYKKYWKHKNICRLALGDLIKFEEAFNFMEDEFAPSRNLEIELSFAGFHSVRFQIVN